MGIAKTGQGKTLAFAIPILQTLAVDPYGIYAVVLTPTRELAGQIGDSFRSVGKSGMNLREVVVTGGRDTIKQSLAARHHRDTGEAGGPHPDQLYLLPSQGQVPGAGRGGQVAGR